MFENMKKVLTIKITLTEEMLGMTPTNPDIVRDFIASKAPNAESLEEEVESMGVDAVIDKTMTVFPRTDDGIPFLWDYQMKGWLKDSFGMLRRISKSECSKITSYKKKIDGLVFPKSRKIPICLPEGASMGNIQRSLRTTTPQGDRVGLANSETIPAGSWIDFTIDVFDDKIIPAIEECLEYGVYRGLGQWRNSGKGLFTYQLSIN